jgi:Fe(3+) dicitrate transport protein
MDERTSVVGSRGHARAVPGSAHFMGPTVLPYLDQSFNNINQLMLRIPGVVAVGEDGYGLRPDLGMRGVEPYRSAQLVIMEDGVLSSPAPYAAPGLPVFAGLGRVQSIQTLKGPGGIQYGPGSTGGTINLQTRPPADDLVGDARLALGSDDAHTLDLSYGDTWQSASWFLGTYQTRTDGFKWLDTGGNTGFDQE